MRSLLVFVAGCSFGMSSVPDDYRPQRGGPPPKCSSGSGAATADFVGALAFAALGGLAYKMSGTCWAHETQCDPEARYLIMFGIPAAAYAGGFVYGTRVSNRCSDAMRSHAELQR